MDGRPGRLAVLRRPGPARDVATAVVTAVVGIVLTIGQPQTLEHLPGLHLGALIGVQVLGRRWSELASLSSSAWVRGFTAIP